MKGRRGERRRGTPTSSPAWAGTTRLTFPPVKQLISWFTNCFCLDVVVVHFWWLDQRCSGQTRPMGRGGRECLGHDGCEESRFGNRCHGDELLLPACEVGLSSRLRHRRGTAHPHLKVKRTLLICDWSGTLRASSALFLHLKTGALTSLHGELELCYPLAVYVATVVESITAGLFACESAHQARCSALLSGARERHVAFSSPLSVHICAHTCIWHVCTGWSVSP